MAHEKATPRYKFEPQEIYLESARLLGKPLAEHEGYYRENDGSWIIADSEGVGRITVRFQGKAKRGHAWNAPDPEGQALARKITDFLNAHDALAEQVRVLREALTHLRGVADSDVAAVRKGGIEIADRALEATRD